MLASYFSLAHGKIKNTIITKKKGSTGKEASLLLCSDTKQYVTSQHLKKQKPPIPVKCHFFVTWSLPLSVHLFISVPRHLRAQRRCESMKETTVPLGMALGKYSTDTKNRLVNFHSEEAGRGACL